MKRFLSVLAVLATVPAVDLLAQAAPAPAFDLRAAYTKREAMIPMRDGVRLLTAIYVPRDTTAPHPIVMSRTPYSCAPYGGDAYPRGFDQVTMRYLRENFIIVCQDVRGRWMSEGDFVDTRPVIENPQPGQIDETTDTYDTIEWLIHNVAGNNGRVGVRGTSYPGFYAEMAAIHAHPALKVVSPQAPVSEWMGGDDFMHHGALLEPHIIDFELFFGWPRPHPTSVQGRFPRHGTPDGYAWYMNLGALSNVNPRLFHDSVAFWDSVLAHPMWDQFWAAHSSIPHLRDLKPAMLWVGGWFDTENLWGALHAYAAAERQSPGTTSRLVMGPWFHGNWNWGGRGDSLGPIAWNQATATFYADSIEVPFFNYYLLDNQPQPRAFEAAVFDTGKKRWTFANQWPIPGGTETSIYLGPHGTLGMSAPTVHGRSSDQYVSDPMKPVPYTVEVTNWYDHDFMVEDQRFAARRPDVLVYESEPLDHDMTVAGQVNVDLWVSTSGTDQDFAVKVIDVYPDSLSDEGGVFGDLKVPLGGYQFPVRMDLLRGKYRNNPDHPQNPVPFTPNAPTRVRFSMNDVYHTFLKGHRMMVQVQSTMFPMFDRNPGRFMNIFAAKDADFRATTQRVFHSAEYPSRIELNVVP